MAAARLCWGKNCATQPCGRACLLVSSSMRHQEAITESQQNLIMPSLLLHKHHLGEARIIFLLSPLQLKHKLRDFFFPFKFFALFSPFLCAGPLSSGKRLPSLEADGKTTVRQTIELSAHQTFLHGGRDGRDSGIPDLLL